MCRRESFAKFNPVLLFTALYVLLFFFKLITEFSRGLSAQLMKKPAEVQRIIIANDRGNFLHAVRSRLQKDLRIRDSKGKNILIWCMPRISFETRL